jgi:small basic protein (TIGR04137 family)
MSMDKSLRVRAGMTRMRSVLTRGERIQKLKDAERWKEGDSPFGLAKVRVYKLEMKKKKKKAKEDEEGADAAAAPAADAKGAGKGAVKAPAAKAPAAKGKK